MGKFLDETEFGISMVDVLRTFYVYVCMYFVCIYTLCFPSFHNAMYDKQFLKGYISKNKNNKNKTQMLNNRSNKKKQKKHKKGQTCGFGSKHRKSVYRYIMMHTKETTKEMAFFSSYLYKTGTSMSTIASTRPGEAGAGYFHRRKSSMWKEMGTCIE